MSAPSASFRTLRTLFASAGFGSLAGGVLGGVDWFRILLQGDFVSFAYLHRFWLTTTAAGAATGGVVGVILVVILTIVRFAKRADRNGTGLLDDTNLRQSAAVRRQSGLIIRLLPALGYMLTLVLYAALAAMTPLLEGRTVVAELDSTVLAAGEHFAGTSQPEESDPGEPGAGAHGTMHAAKPPVILIVLDTVRADHLSLYGYERNTTPSLERFAKDALVCERAVAGSGWTLPSHASIFTGLYSHEHGLHSYLPKGRISASTPWNSFPLREGCGTLAGILGSAGYQTAGLTANPLIRPSFGIARGFQFYFVSTNKNQWLTLNTEAILQRFPGRKIMARFRRSTLTARQFNKRVFHWLENHADESFFLFLNYMDAHSPYEPDPPYDRLFPGRWSRFPPWHIFMSPIYKGTRSPTEQELAHLHSQYDGSIFFLDKQLGRLFDRLKETGLYGESLIIVTSDHGEYFGEHALLMHSKDVYQEVLDIPLIIKLPHSSRVGRFTDPVHLVDILPTVLGTVGLPVPGGISGIPLGGRREEPLLSENYYSQVHDLIKEEVGDRFRRVRRAVYFGQYKFIHSSDGNHELYDISTDPDERIDLALEDPSLFAEYLGLADARIAGIVEPPPPDPKRGPAATGEIEQDQELRRQLEELGYLAPTGR